MKKNNKLIINLETSQKEKIKKNADKAGKTLQQFCLEVLLSSQVEIRIKSRG